MLIASAWLQRWELTVSSGELSVTRCIGPLTLSQRRFPVAAIEGLRVEKAGPLGAGLTILSDAQVLRLAQLNPDAARWLRQWLAAHAGTRSPLATRSAS